MLFWKAIFSAVAIWVLAAEVPGSANGQGTWAQNNSDRNEFPSNHTSNGVTPSNPLLVEEVSDPLLPSLPVERSLSPLEKRTLRQELDRLNARAQSQRQAGNTNEAFRLWFRELKLRRFLGVSEEIQALARVGDLAWRRDRFQEVRWITERLERLETQASITAADNFQLASQLAAAYQQVRSRHAIDLYRQILDVATAENQTTTQARTLHRLGQLHLDYLEYSQAAVVYEELLALLQNPPSVPSFNPTAANGSPITQTQTLEKLVYAYHQSQQLDLAIQRRQDLIQQYRQTPSSPQIPQLQLEMARDWESLGEINTAVQTLQQAFRTAWMSQYYSIAADALQELAALYRRQEQPTQALQVYRTLLEVHRRSRNAYGLMQGYDAIAQLYVERQAYNDALQAFQQGLEQARRLGDREGYFIRQIEQVRQEL
ncbi:tetratricopeptide repeat protein [Geitlerinema sp. PCC 9228]|uniref:tetratricopeptide repeat protein n=1 Tax=Geitlerinema sp. PCC 9228 TaxID=111611 RepID=UPI00111488CF|nr:tetratricopeptide repeat protein [Geitlerinema sp. PCC 9228]